MLTPQEIQDRKFEKAMFGGYDMAQIDQFLDEILVDYTSLYKENAALKSKMRVLVDKIEEYREVDDQMRKALYNAQQTAKTTVEEAKAEAQTILSTARASAEGDIEHLKDKTEFEKKRLEQAKAMCGEYVHKMRDLLSRNIEVLDSIIAGEATLSAESEKKEHFAVTLPSEGPIVNDFEDTIVIQPVVTPVDSGELSEQDGIPVERGISIDEQQFETRFFETTIGEQEQEEQEEQEDELESVPSRGDRPGRTADPDLGELRFGKNFTEQDD